MWSPDLCGPTPCGSAAQGGGFRRFRRPDPIRVVGEPALEASKWAGSELKRKAQCTRTMFMSSTAM